MPSLYYYNYVYAFTVMATTVTLETDPRRVPNCRWRKDYIVGSRFQKNDCTNGGKGFYFDTRFCRNHYNTNDIHIIEPRISGNEYQIKTYS